MTNSGFSYNVHLLQQYYFFSRLSHSQRMKIKSLLFFQRIINSSVKQQCRCANLMKVIPQMITSQHFRSVYIVKVVAAFLPRSQVVQQCNAHTSTSHTSSTTLDSLSRQYNFMCEFIPISTWNYFFHSSLRHAAQYIVLFIYLQRICE